MTILENVKKGLSKFADKAAPVATSFKNAVVKGAVKAYNFVKNLPVWAKVAGAVTAVVATVGGVYALYKKRKGAATKGNGISVVKNKEYKDLFNIDKDEYKKELEAADEAIKKAKKELADVQKTSKEAVAEANKGLSSLDNFDLAKYKQAKEENAEDVSGKKAKEARKAHLEKNIESFGKDLKVEIEQEIKDLEKEIEDLTKKIEAAKFEVNAKAEAFIKDIANAEKSVIKAEGIVKNAENKKANLEKAIVKANDTSSLDAQAQVNAYISSKELDADGLKRMSADDFKAHLRNVFGLKDTADEDNEEAAKAGFKVDNSDNASVKYDADKFKKKLGDEGFKEFTKGMDFLRELHVKGGKLGKVSIKTVKQLKANKR